MSHYIIGGIRGTYSGVLVGGNPFGGDGTKPVATGAVLIPLIIPVESVLRTSKGHLAQDCPEGRGYGN
jgi:hypothetical protein